MHSKFNKVALTLLIILGIFCSAIYIQFLRIGQLNELPKLQKNLLIVAHEQLQSNLLPLVELRQKQGFQCFFAAPPSDKKTNIVPPFQSGYILLVGSKYSPKDSTFFLPYRKRLIKRTFTNRKLNTGFPSGPVPMLLISDQFYLSNESTSYQIGRLPVRNIMELNRTVSKIIHRDNSSKLPNPGTSHQLFLMTESPGFSPTIDLILETTRDALISTFMPNNLEVEGLYSKGREDHSTQVIKILNQGPAVSVYGGHGKPSSLGHLFLLKNAPMDKLSTPSGPLILFGCRTGMNKQTEIATDFFLSEGGPSHVLFSSTVSHPLSDFTFGTNMLQLLNQNPNPTLGELLAMRNKSLHFQGGFQNLSRTLANNLVKLSPEQSEALINDLKFQYNLFGDPSARLFPLK